MKKVEIIKVGNYEIPISTNKNIHPSQIEILNKFSGKLEGKIINIKCGFGSRMRWKLYQIYKRLFNAKKI